MKDKEAIEVLRVLLEKGVLTKEEDEAVRLAIGVLSWTKLAESKIAVLKKKKLRAGTERE